MTKNSSQLIATALTADSSTRVSIFRKVAYTGKTIYIVDFVHMLKRDADRRSVTWKVERTEAAAREAANACFARWNGTMRMIVE
ncbi:hypothetical protein N1031_06835 [Herbiconiux moechotypicola]|uniref:Uncharacterized protein n=1 Tax=Herbiconiux moechotypicola TaxID=637393 RepID=A0ABN3DG00_9MICO|nr:hypothetical protein [Herbiconiux moechotypicola]MCS5729473.1 hypothetical protein [Herbiconiux moechotypicola]